MVSGIKGGGAVQRMPPQSVIVIGGGLFGSIIAHELASRGKHVHILDDERPGAGSKPAACLMKPSWFTGLGREVWEPALALLDRLYGIQDLTFKVGPLSSTVHWVDPHRILRGGQVSRIRREVTTIAQDPTSGEFIVGMWDADIGMAFTVMSKHVVMATGIWSYDLVGGVGGLAPRWGWAHTWEGQLGEQTITPWAPYRQIVAFNRGPNEIWIGDGGAFKNLDPNSEQGRFRHEQSLLRCAQAGNLSRVRGVTSLLGARPYVPGAKPAYLEERMPGLWIATGGAKNGTLAAAWCAHMIGRNLA